jgi:tetratricopeptide (TPR) repeat protein
MKEQGDWEKAMQLFQQSLGIYSEINNAHPSFEALYENSSAICVELAAVHENISAVKVEQGLLEDGIAASAEALKIRRRTQGDDHIDTKGRMEVHRSSLKRVLENRS